MSNVKRVYVEKKTDFAVQAKDLRHEIKHYLGIRTVTGVRSADPLRCREYFRGYI